MALDDISEITDAIELVRAALPIYQNRCLRILVIGSTGSGKTTFCEGLFKTLDTYGQVGDPTALALKAHWTDAHSVDTNTKVPSARVVRLKPKADDQKDDRYMLFVDIPGSWFDTERHQDFVSEAAACTDVWMVMCDFRGISTDRSQNDLARRIDWLLDRRGRERMPYTWVLATHCDGRHRSNNGSFDNDTIETEWGKEWVAAISKGLYGLVIPSRLTALGAQYDIPFHELIRNSRREDVFQRLAELLSVQVERVHASAAENVDGNSEGIELGCKELCGQLQVVLSQLVSEGTGVDLWNTWRVSTSGFGVVLTGYDTAGRYGRLEGFVDQIARMSEYLLSRPGRELSLSDLQPWAAMGF